MTPLKLKKRSFVVKVAYLFSDKNKIPAKTNICSLFWRLPLNLCFAIVVYPVCIVFLSVLYIFAALFVTVFGLFFAYRFNWNLSLGKIAVPYEHWPKIDEENIAPFTVLVLLGVIGLFGYAVWLVFAEIMEPSAITAAIASHPVIFSLVSGIIILTFLAFGLREFFKSETGQLARAWLRAKKEKVCPLVEIVDE